MPNLYSTLYIGRDGSGFPPHCCTGVGQKNTKLVMKLGCFGSLKLLSWCLLVLNYLTVAQPRLTG